jgi:antirestriction protein ArdC
MSSNKQGVLTDDWTPIDHYQTITNHFIKQLHQGLLPWRAGTTVPFSDFAQNYYSGHYYQGINWLMLNLVKAQEVPYYTTWNQTHELGGSVLKGTKSTAIYYFNSYYKNQDGKRISPVHAKLLYQEHKEVQRISYLKRHRVFNLHQTTNLDWEQPQRHRWKTLKRLLKTIKDQHKIQYDTITESCYDVGNDTIVLPTPTKDEVWYNYLLFVHLIHWTGHETRLARTGILNNTLDCQYD